MNHKQQPFDEEIHKYMNFDRLLEDRKLALKVSRTNSIFKWGLPLILLTAVLIGFFYMNDDSTRNAQVTEPQPHNKQEPSIAVLPADTAKVQEEVPSIVVPKEPASPSSGGDNQPEKPLIKIKEKPEITRSGYTQAEPVQGYPELYNYFNENLVYPARALKDSIQGVQTISFVINKEGKPERIEVEQSLGGEFEKESIRLIQNMPDWKPATLNGEPVPSKISIPLTFQIQKIKK